MKNFTEALDFIDEASQYGSVLGLDNIKELLSRLDNPQNKLKVVHVAGTNGKGSVCTFLLAILREAGYRAGSYISPTIFEYRERISVNGEYISEEDFTSAASVVKQEVDKMVAFGLNHPTAFEIETAIALVYFSGIGVDIAIIETGLGGELDATNVFDCVLCSVITSISMDHMRILGDTIEKIAAQKAGIIVKNCPVVVYDQDAAVMDVVRAKAEEKNSQIIIAKNPTSFIENTILGQKFSYQCVDGNDYDMVSISMAGNFQINNCTVVLEVIELLNEQGYYISRNNVLEGCSKAKWPGRFDVISTTPTFVVDGAHNPGAAKRLKESITKYFQGRDLIFIMGVMADKDYLAIIKMLTPMAKKIFTVTPHNERSLDARELADSIREYNPNVQARDSIEDAIQSAVFEAGFDGVVISFGSLYYAGETIRAVKNMF